MANSSPDYFDAFSESAKALIELVLGEDSTDQLHQEVVSYSQLKSENDSLKAEVASLKESLPFKSKYENLQSEFRKVAAERDSLRAQELEISRITNEFERCKSAYQQIKGQLAALQNQIEEGKSSISAFSALESLYQVFKESCDRSGVDIRRIPIVVGLQFSLQDQTSRGSYYEFSRTSSKNWKRTK